VSAFTAGYLARLELWGLLAVLLQGALVGGSWQAWQRVVTGAQARHRVACAHLAALALLPVLTLGVLQATVSGMADEPPRGLPIAALTSSADGARMGLALAVAAAWAAGMATMLLRLEREARALARLRQAPAPARVRDALDRLAARGLVATMPAASVAAVATPQVVGWRRPVLLVPPRLSTQLEADELDAVLLHELAHVRRGDLHWNLLQRLLLALLWFHPVAWRLQAGVARERERCCDALAVRHGASPPALARALVKLAEAMSRPALAMPASRGDGLVDRVRVLIEPARDDTPTTTRVAAALALSAACLLAMGVGRAGLADPSLGDFYMASAFGPTVDIQAHDGAGAFALRVRQGRVIEASVRDQPVRIEQQGGRVTLTDATHERLLELTVTPQNRVQWAPRQ
jgi:beta-lactamase regulating signal transducer with metallopeptidase domain